MPRYVKIQILKQKLILKWQVHFVLIYKLRMNFNMPPSDVFGNLPLPYSLYPISRYCGNPAFEVKSFYSQECTSRKDHVLDKLTEITFPKALSDLLIFAPSLSRSPVAPVLSARSDPAKSTRFITELFFVSPPSFLVIWSNIMVTTVCALLLVAFILVAATVLLAVPENHTRVYILFSMTKIYM